MELPPYPYPAYSIAGAKADRRPSLYPLADETLASGLCDATIPGRAAYDIKAWLVYGTNLLQSLPNPGQTIEAIRNLEFIVSVDVQPAEICGWSDVVLPESTYLERWDDLFAPRFKEPFVALRQPVVEPRYDSRPGWWIAKELGKRLGLDDFFPWRDGAEYVRERASRAGLDFAALRRDGVIAGTRYPVCAEDGAALVFPTPSGKVELHSRTLEQAGFHPLPQYTPPDPPPPGMFRLLSGRAPMHTFGRTINNRFLGQVFDENAVWINADALKTLPAFANRPPGDGERVVLVNQDGVRSRPVRLKPTQRIRGDCVYMVHGFGHSAPGLRFAHGRGASDSELTTRYKVDPIMGGTGMNVNFVRIERAGSAS
jgi:thiosulfate reductase/polysulfide reductase chain A